MTDSSTKTSTQYSLKMAWWSPVGLSRNVMPLAEYRSTCEISVLASDLSEGLLFFAVEG